MEWLEVHIDTNHAGLEPLEIFLSANGVDGVVIDDEQDFQSFLENNHQYWDYVDEDLEASMKGKSRITFYLPADGDGFDSWPTSALLFRASRTPMPENTAPS